MQVEMQRLLIRDVKTEDEIPFVEMAADGSLNDCGFDRDCGRWITKWIVEAKGFAFRDDPDMDYLAYTITLKDETMVVGASGCSYYEDLQKTGIAILAVNPAAKRTAKSASNSNGVTTKMAMWKCIAFFYLIGNFGICADRFKKISKHFNQFTIPRLF